MPNLLALASPGKPVHDAQARVVAGQQLADRQAGQGELVPGAEVGLHEDADRIGAARVLDEPGRGA